MTTQTLGLIGSGEIGSTLARLAVAAGLDVVLSNSRSPQTLAGLVAELGGHARAATPADAARAGDLVMACLPLKAYDQLPAAALAGKTVIDAMNYYPPRDGRIAGLDAGALTSSGLVQRHLTGCHVVKAFNNIEFRSLLTLARPSGAPDRSALPIAGDDAAAKAQVAQLLDTLGYDPVDIGTLADSWRSEFGTPVFVQPYLAAWQDGMSQEDAQHGFSETQGIPVSVDRVRELANMASPAPKKNAASNRAHPTVR
jgi:8-hydroxy-5-deazaflavin:NADPH oxidoreductase